MAMQQYELTDEEVRTICNALAYCSENAIHEDAKARFNVTHQELLRQHTGEGRGNTE